MIVDGEVWLDAGVETLRPIVRVDMDYRAQCIIEQHRIMGRAAMDNLYASFIVANSRVSMIFGIVGCKLSVAKRPQCVDNIAIGHCFKPYAFTNTCIEAFGIGCSILSLDQQPCLGVDKIASGIAQCVAIAYTLAKPIHIGNKTCATNILDIVCSNGQGASHI